MKEEAAWRALRTDEGEENRIKENLILVGVVFVAVDIIV
jgi:hypothetical protein